MQIYVLKTGQHVGYPDTATLKWPYSLSVDTDLLLDQYSKLHSDLIVSLESGKKAIF